jgi:hypothetical protein
MIRCILIKGKLNGHGIVNFDSPSQRWILKERFPQERDALNHHNVRIAKHNFYKKQTEGEYETEWERKLVISSDCLRHAIFGDDFPFQNTSILHHPGLLMKVLASVPALLRGYFFAKEGLPVLKKKSPFMITAAEQTSDGYSHFEVGTMSGAKRSREEGDEDAAGDTSFRHEEKIGDVEYRFEGALDLKELQFISFSQTYDRLAVDANEEKTYREHLSEQLNSPVSEKQYYVGKHAVIRTPEEGILLTRAQVSLLAEELMRRLLSIRIQNAKGYANISELSIKFVKDPSEDLIDDEGGWKKVKQPEDGVPAPDEIEIFYDLVCEEEALELEKSIREAEKEQSDKVKTEKKARKQKKQDAKKGDSN